MARNNKCIWRDTVKDRLKQCLIRYDIYTESKLKSVWSHCLWKMWTTYRYRSCDGVPVSDIPRMECFMAATGIKYIHNYFLKRP